LAERSEVAVRTISNLERGVSAKPYPRSIRLLIEALALPQYLADEVIADYRNGRTAAMQRPPGGDDAAISDVTGTGRRRPLMVPRQLPIVPGHFVGRRAEMATLAKILSRTGKVRGDVVAAVTGMPGVGKTTLVLHWAHRVARAFPDGQLYTDLGGFGPSGTPVDPAAALHGFLDSLGVAAERIPRSSQARTGLYRSLLSERRMLIVLDNARDAEQVLPLLPNSPGCLVLVTSRARLAGLLPDGHAGQLSLDVLSEEEARELLAARLGPDRVAREPDAASELLGLCACLPLAVAIAAARAQAYPELPLAGLAVELGDAARQLDGLTAEDTSVSIRAVMSWSYQQLAELPARMLRSLAAHPGPGITAAAAASMAGIPLSQARLTLRTLAAANLVTEYAPGRYALHDLLRAFAAEQAQAAEHADDHRAATRRMLDHYLRTSNAADLITSWERGPIDLAAPQPGVSPEGFTTRNQALAWFDAERAVLVRVTRRAAEAGLHEHAWQLARSLAAFFRLRGHWHDLVATQRIGLAAARRLGDEGAQARAHCELGFAMGQGSQFDQAHGHLEQALKLYQALGDQQGEVRARIGAGEILSWQGRDREAIASTRAALCGASTEKAINLNAQATALNDLGWYHARLGEFEQARAQCRHALELYRRDGSQYGQGITLDSLAYICHQSGDHAQAIVHYRLAVGHLRLAGALHAAADVLVRLADACQAVGDAGAAEDAWQQAMQILDGMQHPGAREALTRLRRFRSPHHADTAAIRSL
jgi:tetratricopeptide (TPR) repeat protein